jgi:hypothetical protein
MNPEHIKIGIIYAVDEIDDHPFYQPRELRVKLINVWGRLMKITIF